MNVFILTIAIIMSVIGWGMAIILYIRYRALNAITINVCETATKLATEHIILLQEVASYRMAEETLKKIPDQPLTSTPDPLKN